MKGKLKNCALGFLSGILAIMGGVSVFTGSASGNEKEVGASYAVDVQDASASIATKYYGKDNKGEDIKMEGLYVESDKPYSGKFRKVFRDNVSIEYRFPGDRVISSSLFSFTITSVKDGESFKIIYREYPNFNRAQMYVSYQLEEDEYIRTVPTLNNGINKPVSDIGSPSFGEINGKIGDSLSKNTTNQGFAIELNDDIVNVYGKLGNKLTKEEQVLLCSFDGTYQDEYLPDDPDLSEEENAAAEEEAKKNRWSGSYDANTDTSKNRDALITTQNKCFMPKIDFSEGYTVSFESTYESGIEVLFLNYRLGNETHKNNFADLRMQITVSDVKVYNLQNEHRPRAYIGIPLNATDWDIYSTTSFSVGAGEWIDEGDYVTTDKVPFDTTIDTTRLTTYQTDLGGLLSAAVTVAIIEPVDPLSVIGSVSGASVTSNYKQYKISDPSQVNYSGLAIKSENKQWQGELGGVCYGDLELGFRFMGVSSPEVPALYYGDAEGEFTFKIIDATNPDKYFWVSYRCVTANGNPHVTVGVKEGGSRPTTEDMFTAHLGGYINATPAGNGNPANGHFFPAFNSDRIETENAVNVLSFKNTTEEGKMSVAASMGNGCCQPKLHSIRDIGKFDGETKAPQSNLSPLSKLYFPSGYRVEFSTVNATDICFISINGEALNQGVRATASEKDFEVKATYSVNKTTKVEIPLYSSTHGFCVDERVNVANVLNICVNRNPVFSEAIDLNAMMSEKAITVSYGNRISATYQVSVGSPVARCSWDNDISETMDYNVGTGVTVPTPTIDDLVAFEERVANGSYMSIDITKVTIKVLEPNSAEEKSVQDVSFTMPGVYTVLYYAPSVSDQNIAVSVKRTINVINESIPVFTLNGNKVLSGYVGELISIPTATAVADGNECEVNVTISLESEIIASGIDVTSFKPVKAGEYFILYSAVSASGKSNSNGYTVTVLLDQIGPVIYVDFADKTVKPKTMVDLPVNVTATDNVDGDVDVTVSVSFGTENVELYNNNSRFYAEYLGIYTVTYRAVDSKGNQTIQQFFVTVRDAEDLGNTDQPENSGNSGESQKESGTGCKSSVGYSAIVLVPILISVLMILKKKRKGE